MEANQAIQLTVQNAHRATMVRPKNSPESQPIPFHFRGKRFGYCNYLHLMGKIEDEDVLSVAEFPNWEVTEVAHPGYLEEYWNLAIRAYHATSMSPDERGESDIASHEKELHEDLSNMPEEQHNRYIENYKKYFSAMLSSQSRCMSTMVTGPAGFNTRRNDKANQANQNRTNEFREWRKRALQAIERQQEANRPEEEKQNEAWEAVRKDIDSTAATIHRINTGEERGCNKALFVSNLFNRIATQANNGNVEIVDKAVACIHEWNAKVKKPIITERHKFFKLPEVARNVLKQREEVANRENKEFPFDGGEVVFNYEIERLQILFDEKPDAVMCNQLKREFAFNWSPTNKAWQRKLTSNAISAARQALKGLNLRNS